MKNENLIRAIGDDDPRVGQHRLSDVFAHHKSFLFDQVILELKKLGIITAEELVAACTTGLPRPALMSAKNWEIFLTHARAILAPRVRKELSQKSTFKPPPFGIVRE